MENTRALLLTAKRAARLRDCYQVTAGSPAAQNAATLFHSQLYNEIAHLTTLCWMRDPNGRPEDALAIAIELIREY